MWSLITRFARACPSHFSRPDIPLRINSCQTAEGQVLLQHVRNRTRGICRLSEEQNMKPDSRIRLFTLLELLVVIGIIALLAGLLLPVFRQAKDKAHTTSCMNHLGQLGTALTIYRDDNDEEMSPWISTLHPDYLNTREVYRCRKDGNPEDTEDEWWDPHPADDERYEEAYDREGNVGIFNYDPNPDVPRISYFYECSDAEAYWELNWPSSPLTLPYSWAQLKATQLEFGGDYDPVNNPHGRKWGEPHDPTLFPIVRCFWHIRSGSGTDKDRAPVLNVSWIGNVFMSRTEWERGVWTP